MPRPMHTHGEAAAGLRRRLVVGAVVLAVLVLLAGVFAYLTRDARDQAPVPSRSSASAVPGTGPGPGAGSVSPAPGRSRGVVRVPSPPRTSDPVAFGTAFATALWAYDTRVMSQPEFLAGLRRWLTGEARYADEASVSGRVPSPVLWERMRDNGQYATATAAEGHIPDAFTAAMNRDPDAITEAYVYAVTVTGKQAISWRDGGRGAQPQTVTLAVQCRPGRPCALAGIAPKIAP